MNTETFRTQKTHVVLSANVAVLLFETVVFFVGSAMSAGDNEDGFDAGFAANFELLRYFFGRNDEDRQVCDGGQMPQIEIAGLPVKFFVFGIDKIDLTGVLALRQTARKAAARRVRIIGSTDEGDTFGAK